MQEQNNKKATATKLQQSQSTTTAIPKPNVFLNETVCNSDQEVLRKTSFLRQDVLGENQTTPRPIISEWPKLILFFSYDIS